MDDLGVSSWADEIEANDLSLLPPVSEQIVGDTKVLTKFKTTDDGKKVKVVMTFRTERKMVAPSVARRKLLKKFGMSENDGTGPNPSTTVVTDEILMQVNQRTVFQTTTPNLSGTLAK